MNNQRRKMIGNLISKLVDIREDIEAIQAEEQEYFDCMPENFQDGEHGQMAEEAIDEMEDAISSISDALDSLSNAAE